MGGSEKPAWANPEPDVHRALARWAAECAERALPAFEEWDPDDPRPRRALDVLRAWERGGAPMTECRTAAFAAHAAARAATQAACPAATAAARAAGQAAAVAHMADHCSHAAVYAAKAVGLRGSDADRDAERRHQWESLDPALRSLAFPKGL
ncbi:MULTISPECIES: putative immunity protein [unclassified Rathayibacter]|uniref:putative immunity protein n=1 Tax=unclassified Rathayibacter TaxID=2609250 RepID=UPI000CE7DD4D|nr:MULTISPECIES: hypothetical protein [unclassified Rathayibacter]PPG01683.1 hypothetical protein C5C26_16050 [Rathayibacter sp. AY2B1]PPG66239.1 hypothetical protein C5C59_16520 [Rathayibacter sp. AY1F4]